MKIQIVGLGSGGISSISYAAYQALRKSDHVFLRTCLHPIVSDLDKIGITYRSFDHLYEKESSFEQVYHQIADILIREVQSEREILYAVPGHPKVAETSVDILLNDPRLKELSVETELIASTSFLDDMFIFLEIDPTKQGFLLLDALNFDDESLYAKADMVFAQVYSKYIASELKLRLLNHFAEETPIVLFKSAGVKDLEEKKTVFLYEMDHTDFEFDHLSSVFVSYQKENLKYKTFFDLLNTISVLRGENGCPWDKAQNAKSLIPHLREEVQELVDAIEKDDIDNIVEELGDVLMILSMEARFGEEEEFFTMLDVVDGIVRKLIFRHPHVFGEKTAGSLIEANSIWNEQKNQEKLNKSAENN